MVHSLLQDRVRSVSRLLLEREPILDLVTTSIDPKSDSAAILEDLQSEQRQLLDEFCLFENDLFMNRFLSQYYYYEINN